MNEYYKYGKFITPMSISRKQFISWKKVFFGVIWTSVYLNVFSCIMDKNNGFLERVKKSHRNFEYNLQNIVTK